MRARVSREGYPVSMVPGQGLVSPRSGSSNSSSSRRRRMKVERPRRRKRGVNPHERYHRNGTARVVMQSLLVGDQPLRCWLEGLDPSSLSTRLSRSHDARLQPLRSSIFNIFSRVFLNDSISRASHWRKWKRFHQFELKRVRFDLSLITINNARMWEKVVFTIESNDWIIFSLGLHISCSEACFNKLAAGRQWYLLDTSKTLKKKGKVFVLRVPFGERL